MRRDQHNRREFGRRIAWALAAPALAAGCESGTKATRSSALSLTGRTVRVVVIDDSSLAKALQRLQGEWSAETGAELTVTEANATDLLKSKKPPEADVLVYPSVSFGDFAEANWLAALQPSKIASQDFAWSEIFEALTQRETRWGSQNLAAPLGAPPFVCFYREDLLKELDRSPPETWEQYHRLAEILADRSNFTPESIASETWSGAIEPAAKGWAANCLLARAAAYAKHPSHFAALYLPEKMEANIASPAFERALSEMIADRQFSKHDITSLDAAAAQDAFWRGECGMVITVGVPGLAAGAKPPNRAENLAAGFSPLPGSRDVYDPMSGEKSRRHEDASERVTFLGFAGRMISVAENGAYDIGLEFVRRVVATEWNERVPVASTEGSIVSPLQMRRPQSWLVKPATGQEAASFTQAVQKSLSAMEVLHAPRIPGHSEYMQALDEAVRDALSGKAAPLAALQSAAKSWNAITDQIGREAQSRAYQRSLGLDVAVK